MPAALTLHYADFAANWLDHVIPSSATEVARLGFTDCVGVMLAGRHEEVVKRLASHVLVQGATPRARMVGATRRVSMAQAGLVNATAAHALDYDDFAFSNHPSAVLVPTVLAAADACRHLGSDVSGRQMVAAYLVGYEIWADMMLREKDLYYDKGWHPTAVLGPIGAAAAASVVLGLNASQTKDALALAASDSGGVFENFGTAAKPWHGGRAAAAGLNAAGLAAAGVVASATALEGKFGLMRALSPRGDVDLETPPKLGQAWRSSTMRLNIKKYPTVGASQRGIDAVLALNRQEKIDPARVTKIVAHISERHAAVMPYHLPQDAMQAKFSLEFAIASALVCDAVGFTQLDTAVVRLPDIQRLMSLVVTETTAEFESEWRDAAPYDIIHFTLNDGRIVSTPEVRRATGHADTPLSNQELRGKFLGCAHHTGISMPVATHLFETLQRIDQLQSVAEIELPE